MPPKETTFIEYETIEGAEVSIVAVKTRQGLVDSGITMKGRPLKIMDWYDELIVEFSLYYKLEINKTFGIFELFDKISNTIPKPCVKK